ncbi:MAG: alpha/beta hydrolase [Patescibacteria group bacterium]|nr:MAG: alpha/beta hydrolase [Patescibacteria group bacterium]
MERIGFILIHGAGLGAWAWERVMPLLKAPSIAVDLPMRGDPNKTLHALKLEDYVQSVIDDAAKFSVEKFVLVGHSIGGEIALRVATRMPERVAGIVFVSAVIPQPGKAMVSIRPWLERWLMRINARFGALKPPPKVIHARAAHDLDPETLALVLKKYSPESPRIFLDKAEWSLPEPLPRWYVKTLDDRSVPPPLQDLMLARVLPSRAPTIVSGHFPMLAKPRELATILNDFIHHHSLA